VEVAQDGQRERARREAKPAAAAATAAQHVEKGEASNEEENGEGCGVDDDIDELSCRGHFHGDFLCLPRAE
jgi:hypothetical protein